MGNLIAFADLNPKLINYLRAEIHFLLILRKR